jgi:hypothetical protein
MAVTPAFDISAHKYVCAWFLVLDEQIVVGWSKHIHHFGLWHCSVLLLVVNAFLVDILDQSIIMLKMTAADGLRLFLYVCCNIFIL